MYRSAAKKVEQGLADSTPLLNPRYHYLKPHNVGNMHRQALFIPPGRSGL